MSILMIAPDEQRSRPLATACRALSMDCRVDSQPTGERGLHALYTARRSGGIPQVVVLEKRLPMMPGPEVLRRIRTDQVLRSLVMVMLVDDLTPESREAVRAANHCLLSPVSDSGWTAVASVIRPYWMRAMTLVGPLTAASQLPASRICILHVDDDEVDLVLFAKAILKSGLPCDLHSVGNSADALMFLNRIGTHAHAPRPQLILLDLNLPRLDGRSLLKVVKSTAGLKAIPVVILTGSEDVADKHWCRENGANDYVVKPRVTDDLIATISTFGKWLVGSSARPPWHAARTPILGS